MCDFKYCTEIEECARRGACPPVEAVCGDRTAYRFVFDPVTSPDTVPNTDPRSFLPVALLPQRSHAAPISCTSYSLSLYDTEDQARKAFRRIRGLPNIGKTIGTNLARGIVKKEDGVHHPPRPGHYEFWEFKSSSVAERFEITGALP